MNIVKNIENPCTVYVNKKGYFEICRAPKKHLKKMRVRIHAEVGKHFIPNWFDGAVLNHIDRNKLNNHYTNLEWVTVSENSIHGSSTAIGSAKGIQPVTHPLPDYISSTCRQIVCYKTTGEFVSEYRSISSAAKLLNIKVNRITDVLRGFKYDKKRKPIKSHKGYVFKYA
jgi:phage antirepressor YoqD-like protein